MSIYGAAKRTSVVKHFNNASFQDLKVFQGKEKLSKMNFFKRWIYSVVREGKELEFEDQQIRRELDHPRISIDQPDKRISFNVYNAAGGRVVETSRYDSRKDEHQQNLYIINHDADFGKEIDKIITTEYLRK